MVERSIKEISADVKTVFDLEHLSIKLEGKNRRVVKLFANLEKVIFGDPFPTTKPLDIQPEGKDPEFVDILVEATSHLDEALGKLGDKVGTVKKEEKLAKIEGRASKKSVEDIKGFSSVSTKEAEAALEQVSSYVSGILFEYIRAGLLTEEQIKKLGFSPKIVDQIRESLQEEEQNKFDEWQAELEKKYPFLEKLRDLIAVAVADKDLETGKQDLQKALTDARTVLVGEDSGQRGEYLKTTYWTLAEKKLEELTSRHDVYSKEQDRLKTEADKKKNIDDFNDGVKSLEGFMAAIPKAGQEIWELKVAGKFSKFSKLEEKLKEQRRSLQEEWTRLETAGVVKERKQNDPGSEEITIEINSIKTRYRDALERLEDYINAAGKPPVGTPETPAEQKMTKEEIADELIARNWDPFLWHEQKSAFDPRMKDVVQAFKAFAFGKEDDPDEEIDRVVQKVRVQLVTWDNFGIHEVGKASTNRGLLEEQINNRQFARHELMIASLYNPEWGKDTKSILEYVTKVSALRINNPPTGTGEKLVRRGGELVHLLDGAPMLPGDVIETDSFGNQYVYTPGMGYNDLASDRGREILEKKIEEKFPKAHKMAKWFANILFTSMDMLSIPLMEMQLKTATRAHNGAIGGKDYVSLWKPESGYAHRSERYGGVTADWMGWWLYYLPDIDHNSQLGRPVTAEERAAGHRTYDAQYLEEKQNLVKLQQRAYFDGSGSEGEVKPVGFCESYFPHTYEALQLHPGEYLEVGGKVIDWQGNPAPPKKEQKMAGYDLYFVAESGWEKMLELTFKALESDLTYEHILEELSEGGKGGILSQFMGDGAGRAKMFKGEHLKRALQPLLLHLIRRIFALYKGRGEQAELRLFKGVVRALEDSKSGGLAEYAVQIDEVLEELKKPPHLYGEMSLSLQKRDAGNREPETKEYMQAWYRDEFHEEPPQDVWGHGVVLDGNHQKENYLKVLRNHPDGHIPVPLVRQGDLIQKKEG